WGGSGGPGRPPCCPGGRRPDPERRSDRRGAVDPEPPVAGAAWTVGAVVWCRGSGGIGMFYTFDGYELDLDQFELRRDGERVAVEPQVFDVLAHLVEHRTRVVPKVELLESV